MDEKQAQFQRLWDAAKVALARSERDYNRAEGAYQKALEGGDRRKLAEATFARQQAADTLHTARVKECEGRKNCGYDGLQSDSLRLQTRLRR